MNKQTQTIQTLGAQLTKLVAAADAMRQAQRQYAASPTGIYLHKKNEAEKQFDLVLAMVRTTPAAPLPKKSNFSRLELFEAR